MLRIELSPKLLSPCPCLFLLLVSPQPSGSLRIVIPMTSKRIETGTPEGDALGFLKIFSQAGWRHGMITVFSSIISYHGTGIKEIPRYYSGDGYWMAGMSRWSCHGTSCSISSQSIISYRPDNIFLTSTRTMLKSG